MSVQTSVLSYNVIRFRATFKEDGETPSDPKVLADPTEVEFRFGLEGEPGEVISHMHISVGVFQADWDTTPLAEGTYWILIRGTGAVVAAREIRIKVRVPHLMLA